MIDRRSVLFGSESDATGSTPDLWDGDVRVEEAGYFTDLLGVHAAREIARMSGRRAGARRTRSWCSARITAVSVSQSNKTLRTLLDRY